MKVRVWTYKMNDSWFVMVSGGDLPVGYRLENTENGLFSSDIYKDYGFKSRRAAREALRSYCNRIYGVTVTGGLH